MKHATLTVGDRLILRKLFQALWLSCKSGEEAVRAGEFLSELVALAKSAGGDAPLPTPPAITEIEDTQRLVGNEQLVAIKTKAPQWEDKIKAWMATRDLIAQRLPTWTLVERLAKHASAISEAKPHLEQIEAIRSQRLLLEKSDPASAIRVALAGLLRDAVQKGRADYEAAFSSAMASLAGNSMWVKVAPVDQEAIKAAVGLSAPSKPNIAADDALVGYLDQKPLSNIQAEIDAIAGRVALAIERAARLLERKVQTITLSAGGFGYPPARFGLAPRFAGLWIVRASIPMPRTNGAQTHVVPFYREVAEPQERHTQEGERQIERDNSAQGPVHRGHRQETAAVC